MPEPSRLPITVCIPVKNEEKNLPDCLASLRDDFEEIVILDSDSTDKTTQIAEEAGITVLNFKWDGKYPKKRNWALRTYDFKTPWVFFLDADERVTREFVDELRGRIADTPHVGFWISFDNWFMDRHLRHGDQFRKLSLFRLASGEYEKLDEGFIESTEPLSMDIEVHEHPVLDGTTTEINARLQHYEFRGLRHYIAKHNEYSSWEADRFSWLTHSSPEAMKQLTKRQRFKYKNLHRWWLGMLYFFVAYVVKLGFLDGRTGLLFNRLKWRYFSDIRMKIHEKKHA